MKNGLVILNVILLMAVGVLFYLFFNKKDNTTSIIHEQDPDTAPQWQHTPVAYFDMDSIEANFVYGNKCRLKL
jgi:outer membrane protein